MALYNCPRISFSIDFSDSQQQQTPIVLEKGYNEAPVSSDFDFFEFSVPEDTMISADELFFKGRMLPLKENRPRTTLRDELRLADNDDDSSDIDGGDDREEEEEYAPTTTRIGGKGTARWRERLGLKRSNGARVVPKKGGKNGLERIDERSRFEF